MANSVKMKIYWAIYRCMENGWRPTGSFSAQYYFRRWHNSDDRRSTDALATKMFRRHFWCEPRRVDLISHSWAGPANQRSYRCRRNRFDSNRVHHECTFPDDFWSHFANNFDAIFRCNNWSRTVRTNCFYYFRSRRNPKYPNVFHVWSRACAAERKVWEILETVSSLDAVH